MAVLDYLELPVKSTQEQQRFYGTAFGWCFTSYGPDYAAHEGGPCQMGLNGVDNPQRSTGILPIIRVSDVEADGTPFWLRAARSRWIYSIFREVGGSISLIRKDSNSDAMNRQLKVIDCYWERRFTSRAGAASIR